MRRLTGSRASRNRVRSSPVRRYGYLLLTEPWWLVCRSQLGSLRVPGSATGSTDPGAPPAASGRRITRRRFEGCPIPNVPPRGGSASAAGDERDDDVGGVAVEVLTAPVVDGRGAGVGVTSGRDAGSVGSTLPIGAQWGD